VETKPGIYTTEFWTSLLVGLFFFLDAVGAYDLIPKNWAAIGLAIIGGLYTASRGIAKIGATPDMSVPANTNVLSVGDTQPPS
jgi:hypothetical protein